jgi:hypothetical protein
MSHFRLHPIGRLRVEQLEDRTPPSTALDALLAGVGSPDSEPSPFPSVEWPDQFGTELGTPTSSLPVGTVGPVTGPGGTETQTTSTAIPDFPPLRPLGDLIDQNQLLLAAPAGAVFPTLRPIPVEELHPGAAGVASTGPVRPPELPAGPGGPTTSADPAAIPVFLTRDGGSGGDEGGSDPTIRRGILLDASTPFVPVNANRTSGSPWQKDAAGNEQPGLPVVRDFDLSPMRNLGGWNGVGDPPAGAAIIDPELKALTATVVDGPPIGTITVVVANSGQGRIRLWTDQSKTTEIPSGGVLPGYPVYTFYAEGIEPSQSLNDITVQVITEIQGASYVDERQLTVTPVTAEFSVTPKQGGQVTYLLNGDGQVVGLNSGTQSMLGGPADSGGTDPNKVGAIFTADLNPRTNVPGTRNSSR